MDISHVGMQVAVAIGLRWLLPLAALIAAPVAAQDQNEGDWRPRVVVTADPELDDSNSLTRYLLYTPDFRTEAIIYASSGVHWKGDGRGTAIDPPDGEWQRFGLALCPCTSWRWAEGERFIDATIDAYAEGWPNLRVHDPRYPAPDHLRSLVLEGNVAFPGDISADSAGSNRIRALLLDDQPGPLYPLAWGGTSTIARALKSIEDEFAGHADWPAIQARVSGKAVIQAFGDQDGSYAAYIAPHWPQVEFRQMATRIWGYGARDVVRPDDAPYLTAAWTQANVSSRGALGAHYRVWGDGRQMVPGDRFDYFHLSGLTAEELRAQGFIVWAPVQEAGSWISEGDSSTFMNLVANGLQAHRDMGFGGWGGGADDSEPVNGLFRDATAIRFFGAAQRDFAARLQWAVTADFAAANHAPLVTVHGPAEHLVSPGERVVLRAVASDPDHDPVTLRWWQFAEAGSYSGTVTIDDAGNVAIPADAASGQTIHLIAEVRDQGTPMLTSYARVILTVR
jgi:hypothetical protein